MDDEYEKFCLCLTNNVEVDNDTNTDDNDPPYVYNDDIYCYGWKFNLDEALYSQEDNLAPDYVMLNDFEKQQTASVQNQSSFTHQPPASSSAVATPDIRRKLDIFSEPEFARVLNQQLRQHIQLLTQSYILTKNTTNMKNYADEAKEHLDYYIKIFKNRRKPSNLLPALYLVNNLPVTKEPIKSIRLSWRHLPIPDAVRDIISKHPDIFIYRSLLPQVAFSLMPKKVASSPGNKPKKQKINFTLNEDKLLAFALNEFKGESQYASIASLLMTAKTKQQINNHIKNIKRSPGNEDNPIKSYFSQGALPHIDLDSDSEVQVPSLPSDEQNQMIENDDMLEFRDEEMGLDDLIAASTTISNAYQQDGNRNIKNNKNIKNLKLRKSMLNLMTQKFSVSRDMGDLIVHDFLKTAQESLSERNYIHLLQLLTNLMKKEIRLSASIGNKSNVDVAQRNNNSVAKVYNDISEFLKKINGPSRLQERLVLFLNFDQATKCGCALNYLHWMRFFEFMQHVELYHDGEAVAKKLARLIDALQKDDQHRVKLAAANLVNKHPLLKREFDALSLDSKPHASLFICEEDFDDITEPIVSAAENGASNLGDQSGDLSRATASSNSHDSAQQQQQPIESGGAFQVPADVPLEFEHFQSKPSKEEAHYATRSCPCKCHSERHSTATTSSDPNSQPQPQPQQQQQQQHIGQHCGECNLKFIKGKMYLVNKIKPILAKWSYTSTQIQSSAAQQQPQQAICDTPSGASRHSNSNSPTKSLAPTTTTMPAPKSNTPMTGAANCNPANLSAARSGQQQFVAKPSSIEWTFEEDKEILEFCQAKAELNEETVSFDSNIFEELVSRKRRLSAASDGSDGGDRPATVATTKKTARQIAERFNHLMEMYRMDENSNAV